MEANILLFMCGKANQPYGVRVQRMEDGDWWRTWAFKVKPQQAKSEGFDKTMVQGNLYATREYPGCPYCGATGFVQCGTCGKISCWKGENTLTCLWCGKVMNNIVTTTEKFSVSGDKF